MSESTSQISPEVRKQMESICRRAVSGRDDARISDEIFGHLEDKLLAYLRGDERLTEADAMILVREHFGHPDALRAMLGGENAETPAADRMPLSRRLLISALAMSVVLYVVPIFAILLNQTLRWKAPQFSAAPWRSVANLLLSLIATVAFFKLAKRWHRNSNEAQQHFLHRWHWLTILLCVAAVAVLQPFTLSGLHRLFATVNRPAVESVPQPQWFWWWISFSSIGLVAVQANFWIRLSSRGRVWPDVFISAAAWVGFWAATQLVQAAAGWLRPQMMASDLVFRDAAVLIVFAAIAAGIGLLLIPLAYVARWSIEQASRVRLTLATPK